MKVAFIYLILTISTLACGNKQTNQTTSSKSKSEKSLQIDIKGIWTIKNYYFSDISAMDEKMAKEWLNKSVRIDDKLHFNFQEIASYKDIFKSENNCAFLNIGKPEVASKEIYFDAIRDPLTELKIKKSTINIYKTNCNDNPFSEFVINEDQEIIFRWDGVFFIMTKE